MTSTSSAGTLPSDERSLSGHFIPRDEYTSAVPSQLAHLSRESLNRARAERRKHFTLYRLEHVYRNPDTGELVDARDAPQRAFIEVWELAGHRVHGERRSLARQESIFKRAREVRIERIRGRRAPGARPNLAADAGHAPREGFCTRSKGSRRSTAKSSGGSESDPDEPPGGRPTGPGAPCWCGCGEPIPEARRSNARYVDDRHGSRYRQREKRAKGRPRPRTPAGIDRYQREPALADRERWIRFRVGYRQKGDREELVPEYRLCRHGRLLDGEEAFQEADREHRRLAVARRGFGPEPSDWRDLRGLIEHAHDPLLAASLPAGDRPALRRSLAASRNGGGGHVDRVARARAMAQAVASGEFAKERPVGGVLTPSGGRQQ
jgi:hypothetical protein